MREWVSVNGRLLPADQATVSVFDSGFMQGVGLFETMRSYQGVPFRLDQHLERLIRSAETLGWTIAPAYEALRASVLQSLGATELGDARVRLTVTAGSLRAIERQQPELTVVAGASSGMTYPRQCYREGVSVCVSAQRQCRSDPTLGHKTTSYFSRLQALRRAHAVSAFEALWFTEDGFLAEGSISNVFVVRDERLITPAVDTPLLPGITRAAVIELAAAASVELSEASVSHEELLAADEIFLTNSMMEIVPVVRVGREAIGNERPGEITRRMYEAYGDLVERECGSA